MPPATSVPPQPTARKTWGTDGRSSGRRRRKAASPGSRASACARGQRLRRLDDGLHAHADEGGAGADEVGFRRRGEAPERAGVGKARVAVHEQRAAAADQRGGEQVPHDPAARGVPEEALAAPQVELEGEALQRVHQHAAVAVHDRLGRARGAGGKDDPQRMVERQLLELRFF